MNHEQIQSHEAKHQAQNHEEQHPSTFEWDGQTDQLLLELYKTHQGNWQQMSRLINGTSPLDCLQRWNKLHPEQVQVNRYLKPRTRQLWSPEEDQQLQQLVQQHGKKWSKICTIMNWRTGKQVRERYLNQLQGTINTTKWTEEEDKLILKLYKKFGTRWSYISSFLEGRPENMVKNRFYANLKRRYSCDIDDSDDEDLNSESSGSLRKSIKKTKKFSKKIPTVETEDSRFLRLTRSKQVKNEGNKNPEQLESEEKHNGSNSLSNKAQTKQICKYKLEIQTTPSVQKVTKHQSEIKEKDVNINYQIPRVKQEDVFVEQSQNINNNNNQGHQVIRNEMNQANGFDEFIEQMEKLKNTPSGAAMFQFYQSYILPYQMMQQQGMMPMMPQMYNPTGNPYMYTNYMQHPIQPSQHPLYNTHPVNLVNTVPKN